MEFCGRWQSQGFHSGVPDSKVQRLFPSRSHHTTESRWQDIWEGEESQLLWPGVTWS